jgi:pimeloyl-ACP methyl ester carboxylesterase
MKTELTKIKNLIIDGKHQKPILTDLFFIKNNRSKPVVIFCHGYKGYKDWGAWHLIANEFAANDFFFVKFNFSHNGGTIENPIDFPDLEAFGNNNYSKELDDLESVIDSILSNNEFKLEIDKTNIILIGHSRGGGIVSLKASQNKKVTKVISWNGISDIEARFPKGEALEKWKKDGIGYIQNTRTKQQMPNKFQIYEDFVANKEKLHIQTAVENLTIPHLIIQGSNDEVVLPVEAESLHRWNPNSKLIIIKNMNHALGNTQPWLEDKMPTDLKTVVKQTVDFIKN